MQLWKLLNVLLICIYRLVFLSFMMYTFCFIGREKRSAYGLESLSFIMKLIFLCAGYMYVFIEIIMFMGRV